MLYGYVHKLANLIVSHCKISNIKLMHRNLANMLGKFGEGHCTMVLKRMHGEWRGTHATTGLKPGFH